ncbi:MAG: hypothetical protein RL514_346 [Verrucomicrobiota bacterium]|jgi:hypothetical protein
MTPISLKLNLKFGQPNRLRIAEVSNWSGVALAAPRTDLEFLLQRSEVERAGVYVLLGESDGGTKPQAYIGEAEDVGQRLPGHSGKDFWSVAFVFTDKDGNLTKAHIRYLEGVLIETAREAGRYEVVNSVGSGSKLPESEKDIADAYLGLVKLIMPVLGCDLLTTGREVPKAVRKAADASEYAEALRCLGPKLSDKHREMLLAHFHASDRKVTAGQLAAKVGYASFGAANLHYGKLGVMIGKQLGLSEQDVHVGVLVLFIRPNTEGNKEWIWQMRPELAVALERLKWV